MKMKKILALVLALTMLLSLLVACNNEKPTETNPAETKPAETKPAETQPVETTEPKPAITFPLAETLDVSVMYILGNASYPIADNVAWKYLQEIWNMNFDTLDFTPSDAKEKMNLLMSSGEYTDILFKANKIDLDKYGMDGILIPLEDMIKEYMPNLSALLDERDAWADIAAPDGHIYALPSILATDPKTGSSYWWINKGWLDKLGLKEPKTMDDLYTVLKAFKEQDPNGNGKADEIPVGVYSEPNAYNMLLALFTDGQNYTKYWEVMDGQMEYLPTTEYFKENLLEPFQKMYAEGLLTADMFTMDRDKYRAVCGGEEVIYGLVYDSTCAYFANTDEQLGWVTLKPTYSESWALSKGVQEGGLAITDKCANPEIILAAVDYLYTEEGGRIIRNGVEGVSYKWNEDGTWSTIKDGFDSPTYQATLMGTATVPGKIPDSYYELPASKYTRWQNSEIFGKDHGVGGVGQIVPNVNRTEEEDEEYSVLYTDISSYVNNYVAECTTGIVSIEETWETFQATLKEMGVDRMIEIQRAAYERAAG